MSCKFIMSRTKQFCSSLSLVSRVSFCDSHAHFMISVSPIHGVNLALIANT